MNDHDDDTFAGFARRFALIETEVMDPPTLRRVRGTVSASDARWSLTGLTTVLALVAAVALLGPFIAGRTTGGPTSTSPVVIGATSPTPADPAVTCGRIAADQCESAIDLVRDGHQSEVADASAIVVEDICPPDAVCDLQYPFESIVVLVPAEGVLGDLLTFRAFGTDGPERVVAWHRALPRHVVALLPGAPVPSVAEPTSTAEPERLASPLVITNATERQITLLIDSEEFSTIVAYSVTTFPAASVPLLPFRIEARLPSGRVIAAQRVSDAEGFRIRIGLTCGDLDIWSGGAQADAPRPDPAEDIQC